MSQELTLLKEIKNIVKRKIYSTKIQSHGKNKKDEYNYIIYVTRAVNDLQYSKGDLINFTLDLISKKDTKNDIKPQDVVKKDETNQDVVYEKKDGITSVKLDVSKDIAAGKPKEAAKKIISKVNELVDPEFENWKVKYEEYKQTNDNRIGAHIIVGKQKFKEVEEYIEEEDK